jgi:hypothetical protein
MRWRTESVDCEKIARHCRQQSKGGGTQSEEELDEGVCVGTGVPGQPED